ncbi:MAG: Hpt domain-containing protein [Geobacteraceae bacterium]|nr:Hpt domain-containing protein [Geobacteraceae bacterium]
MTEKTYDENEDENPSGEVFNRPALLARIGGRQEMIPGFVALFSETIDKYLPGLEEAVTAGDLQAARKIVHTLKGMAGNISAERIQALALRMETMAKSGDVNVLRRILARLNEELGLFRSAAA